jgi:hypothetical protein
VRKLKFIPLLLGAFYTVLAFHLAFAVERSVSSILTALFVYAAGSLLAANGLGVATGKTLHLQEKTDA